MDSIEKDLQPKGETDIPDVNTNSLTSILNKKVTRREFLESLGLVLTSLVLPSCAPKKTLPVEKDSTLLDRNVDELNTQFSQEGDKHLNSDRTFNYDKYLSRYPELNRYKGDIDKRAEEIYKYYGINPDVMRGITYSIISNHLGSREEIDYNKDIYNQRIGPMQFYSANIFLDVNSFFKMKDGVDKRTGKDVNTEIFSIENAFDDNEDNMNIRYGMIALAESLRTIENNGENNNLMSLMLADYYGGSALLDIVKKNQTLEDNNYLKPNYTLYQNALNILNNQLPETENISELEEVEPATQEVWRKTQTYWPKSRFRGNEKVFREQLEKYKGAFGLNQAQLLSLFVSVAMTESQGGVEKYNAVSGALGWYQVVPQAGHITQYNDTFKTQYTENDVLNNDTASIEVGVWSLMRYMNNITLHRTLHFFKAGGHFEGPEGEEILIYHFGNNFDDGLWWNRVSYCSQKLLDSDVFGMGYIEYEYDKKRYPANSFLQDKNHIHPKLFVEN
jgi:hypothetical protein